MKIIIRNDDVLIEHRIKNAFNVFQSVHSLICSSPVFIHKPAILCGKLETFPNALDYINKETSEGRMFPEIHGWEHIDYGRMSKREIKEDLEKCLEWFKIKLNYLPNIFYTPWASETEEIDTACKELGLKMVGGKRNFIEPHKYLDGRALLIEQSVIAIHWWKAVDVRRLERIIKGEIKWD